MAHKDPWLKLKYEAPDRWSYTFQDLDGFTSWLLECPLADTNIIDQASYEPLSAILTRLKQTDEPQDGMVRITERSIYSNRYIFGPLQNKLGFMSSTEFQINCEWTEYLIETFPQVKVDAFLYLKVRIKNKIQQLSIWNIDDFSLVDLGYHYHTFYRLILTSVLVGLPKEPEKVKSPSILTTFTSYTNSTKNGSIKTLSLNPSSS